LIHLSPEEFNEIFNLLISDKYSFRKKAIARLYEVYRPIFLRIIKREFYYKSLDSEFLEDLIQDTFVSLLSKKTVPSSSFAISQWLKSYTLNIARDSLKRAYRHHEFSNDDEHNKFQKTLDKTNENVSNHDTFFESECLRQAIINYGTLHPVEMEILTFAKTKDMKYSEIATIFGKSESNIKKIISIASRELKRLMDDCINQN